MDSFAPIFFALAMISNVLSIENKGKPAKGTPVELEAIAKPLVVGALDTLNEKLKKKDPLVHLELAWGPVVYQAPGSQLADNVMFVARNKVYPHNYTVAIAGTNFGSLFDWLVEDGTVAETSPWNGTKAAGRIAKGTRIGLENLQGMEAVPSYPLGSTQSLTLADYLEQQTKKDRRARISVTGHSLGGALAPVTGLWLNEAKANWSHKPKIYVYSFAGPTPGDENFAAYYAKKLGYSTFRGWNELDAVPHAWSQTKNPRLSQIPGLYANLPPANQVPKGIEMDLIVDVLEFVSRKTRYTPVNAAPGFSVSSYAEVTGCDSDLSKFVVQAIYQHINAYWAHYMDVRRDPLVDCPTANQLAADLKAKLEEKRRQAQ